MVYLEINKKNYGSQIDKINDYLSNKDTKSFILFYMEGCVPCNATRPEWSKIKNVLSNDILKSDNILILSIDKDLFDKLKNVGPELNSFPTMRFITDAGEKIETYEDSDVPENKDRTIDSFIEWIKSKTGDKSENAMTGGKRKIYKKISRTKKRRGGKWSLKYKRGINCRKPKGFSQKQYCKYGKKK